MPTTVTFTRKVTCLSGASKPHEIDVQQNKRATKDIQLASLRDASTVATFVSAASISPIVGLPNFAKSIRRLSAEPAGLGVDTVRVITKGTRNPAQFRASLSVDIVKFANGEIIDKGADYPLLLSDGFNCFANADTSDIVISLPTMPDDNAVNQAIGLTYFFFVRSGSLGIKANASGAKNQIINKIDGPQDRFKRVNSGTAGETIAIRLEGKSGSKYIWIAENVSSDPNWSFIAV